MGGDKLPAHCSDGKKNSDESDVDCGGKCAGCTSGQHCDALQDCESSLCLLGFCLSLGT